MDRGRLYRQRMGIWTGVGYTAVDGYMDSCEVYGRARGIWIGEVNGLDWFI